MSATTTARQRFEAVINGVEVEATAAKLGWSILLKARRNAHEGKGNATLRSAADTTESRPRGGKLAASLA